LPTSAERFLQGGEPALESLEALSHLPGRFLAAAGEVRACILAAARELLPCVRPPACELNTRLAADSGHFVQELRSPLAGQSGGAGSRRTGRREGALNGIAESVGHTAIGSLAGLRWQGRDL
jgi:protein involved in temperature-dependent protein secretion